VGNNEPNPARSHPVRDGDADHFTSPSQYAIGISQSAIVVKKILKIILRDAFSLDFAGRERVE
jgi:hypothetical protein